VNQLRIHKSYFSYMAPSANFVPGGLEISGPPVLFNVETSVTVMGPRSDAALLKIFSEDGSLLKEVTLFGNQTNVNTVGFSITPTTGQQVGIVAQIFNRTTNALVQQRQANERIVQEDQTMRQIFEAVPPAEIGRLAGLATDAALDGVFSPFSDAALREMAIQKHPNDPGGLLADAWFNTTQQRRDDAKGHLEVSLGAIAQSGIDHFTNLYPSFFVREKYAAGDPNGGKLIDNVQQVPAGIQAALAAPFGLLQRVTIKVSDPAKIFTQENLQQFINGNISTADLLTIGAQNFKLESVGYDIPFETLLHTGRFQVLSQDLVLTDPKFKPAIGFQLDLTKKPNAPILWGLDVMLQFDPDKYVLPSIRFGAVR
jgi:hypothetical protein